MCRNQTQKQIRECRFKKSNLNCRLVLLNKLLEDGNVLYRKSRLREAAHRYNYALSKFPQNQELDPTFKQLRLNFLLNFSRCKRKMSVRIENFFEEFNAYTLILHVDLYTGTRMCHRFSH